MSNRLYTWIVLVLVLLSAGCAAQSEPPAPTLAPAKTQAPVATMPPAATYTPAPTLAPALSPMAIPSASPAEISLTEADAGSRVEVRLGQVLNVKLPGNPTTGYTWLVAAVNASILQQAGEPQFMPDSQLLGAPGNMLFQFKVVGTGECALQMAYRRPWENQPPERTFSIQVIAR